MNTAEIIADNQKRWDSCQILSSRELQVEKIAAALCAPKAKTIYQTVSQSVWAKPDRWWIIAVIHEREANQNFADSIAQGDPWNQRSRHVPRGIGPFNSFVAAAVFSMTRCAPYPSKWQDWSPGGVMTLLEAYNGYGYENYHNEPSPYDWGATNVEEKGKYIADGKYDPNVWDEQVGCAAMLKAMMQLDSSIKIA